jgi:hypothetical protein
MPGGQGYRARTRYMFSRAFRGKGYIPLSVYLRSYQTGDYVDIKVNSAIHKVRAPAAGHDARGGWSSTRLKGCEACVMRRWRLGRRPGRWAGPGSLRGRQQPAS